MWTEALATMSVGALVVGTLVVADAGQVIAAPPPAAVEPAEPAQPGPLEAPDLASARLTAELRNARVEVLDARTETFTMWVNPDGTTTTEDALAPIRVRRGEGWADIDLNLVDRGGVLEPTASPVDVKVRKDRTSSLATLAKGKLSAEIGWKSEAP